MSAVSDEQESPLVVWGIRIGCFILVVVAWQIIGSLVNPLFLSTPTAIAASFVQLASITSGHYSLFWATVTTIEATLIGFGASVLIGLPIGFCMGMYRRVDTMVGPFVNALYVTPRVALVPIFVVWFGISIYQVIATCVMIAVFPVIMNTYAGVRDMSKTLLDTADVFQIKGLRRFSLVTFPAILPFFMTGLRLAIGQALTGVIVAEILASLTGMGYMLLAFTNYVETANVMACVIVLMVLGVALTYAIEPIETRLASWKETERGYR